MRRSIPQGVRIGTADIYNIVERMPEIQEALAVDQAWEGSTRIVLFVKMQEGRKLDKDLESRIRKKLQQDASPRHVPAVIVEAPICRTRAPANWWNLPCAKSSMAGR